MNNILSTAACSLQLHCSAGRTHSALEGNTAACGWPSCGVCFAWLCSANLYTMFLTMSQNLYTVNNTNRKTDYRFNQCSAAYKILIYKFYSPGFLCLLLWTYTPWFWNLNSRWGSSGSELTEKVYSYYNRYTGYCFSMRDVEILSLLITINARAVPETLKVTPLVTEFLAFYETWRSITILTRAQQWSLCKPSSHLILSSTPHLYLQSALLPIGFPAAYSL
jgi:hypothetical protein